MFLIAGTHGTLNNILTNNIPELSDAVLFELHHDSDEGFKNLEPLKKILVDAQVTTVIVLPFQDGDFIENDKHRLIRVVDEVNCDIVRHNQGSRDSGISIIDVVNMNEAVFDSKVRKKKSHKRLNSTARIYTIPLPMIVQDNGLEGSENLFYNVLMQFVQPNETGYYIDRYNDETIYVTTTKMVIDTFTNIIGNMVTYESGLIPNENCIALTIGEFVETVLERFPNLTITTKGNRDIQVEPVTYLDKELFKQSLHLNQVQVSTQPSIVTLPV